MAESSQHSSTFDEHAHVYESLVDWPRRLAREEPFYRRVFEQVGVKRVLDAACGTGHHAAMFASWGLEVEGADISPGMIAQAREQFGEPSGLRWSVRSFDQPVAAAASWDAVICVGNSLALAGEMDVIDRALGCMLNALRPGGVCIIGVLNLWRLPQGATRWDKCKPVQFGGGLHVLLKSIRRCGDRGYIDFVDLAMSGSSVSPRYDAAEFVGVRADELIGMASAHGGTGAELYGSYDLTPYEESQSTDLLFTCRRR